MFSLFITTTRRQLAEERSKESKEKSFLCRYGFQKKKRKSFLFLILRQRRRQGFEGEYVLEAGKPSAFY